MYFDDDRFLQAATSGWESPWPDELGGGRARVRAVNEVVVDDVSYEGTTLDTLLSGVSGGTASEYLRLDVYLDGADVREPYLIRAHVDALGNGQWSWPIDRCWPFANEARFELWVTPAVSTGGDPKPYTDTDSKVGEGTVVPASSADSGSIELGNQNLTLNYSTRDAPSATHREVNDPNSDETRTELVRTRGIESAIQDFDAADGVSFLTEENITRAARELSSRLDIVSAEGNTPDGFPDEAVVLSDQDDRDYCAATALLFAFSQKQPRRLVEFCRSIYDPISIEADGSTRYGYLSRSVTPTYNVDAVEGFYENQQRRQGGRTTYQATVDVLILLIRGLLSVLPPIPRSNKDQYRSIMTGLTSFEMRELLGEVVGVTGGSVFKNDTRYHPLSEVLDAAVQASSPDRVCMLNIESLLVEGWKPRTAVDLDSCPPYEGGNHTITVLSMQDNNDDTYTIGYQDPWGGEYGGAMTVEETVLDELVTGVVVTGVSGGV